MENGKKRKEKVEKPGTGVTLPGKMLKFLAMYPPNVLFISYIMM